MQRLAWLSIVAGIAIVGCDRKPKTPTERGASIFLRSCAGCHGPDGRGALRQGLSVKPRNLTDPDFQSKLTDESMRDTIKMGKGQMPPFEKHLTQQDVDDLVLFVRTLKRTARPR